MRRWRWRLEWCSYKPRNANSHEKLEEVRNKFSPWAFRERTALLTPCFWTSSLRRVRIHFCCFKSPVYDHLLQQTKEHRYLFLTVLFIKFQMYTHREIHIFRSSFCNSPSTQTLYKSCQVHLISALPSNMEEARSISLGLIVWRGEEEEGHHPLIGPTDLPNQMELEVVTTFHQGLHLCFTEKELMRCYQTQLCPFPLLQTVSTCLW